MKFEFNKNKYGRELLIDCLVLEKTKEFKHEEAPFLITFHEILFITSGTGEFLMDNQRLSFEPGTVLFLPPNKWRKWESYDVPPTGFILLFEEDFIATFFNDIDFLYRFHFFYSLQSKSSVKLEMETFRNLVLKVQEIKAEIQGLRGDSDHLLRSLLYYILISLNRVYEEQHEVHGEFFEDTLTLTFRRLLEKRITHVHRVSDYAELLGVSKSHLNSTLKKHFNKSASDIIKDRLLTEIKRELLFGKKSISEICYSFNFSEPSNFNRFFKARTGYTPIEFRTQNQK